MNARTRDLLLEVLDLPRDDRALIKAELEASLEGEEDDASPEEVEEAWAAEIERRAADVLAGRRRGRPADEVLAEIRVKLAARRG